MVELHGFINWLLKFNIIHLLLLKNNFSDLCCFPLPIIWTYKYTLDKPFDIVPLVTKALVLPHYFSSVFLIGWIFIFMFNNNLFSSTWSDIMFTPYNFYFKYYMFNYGTSIWFFLIFFIHPLWFPISFLIVDSLSLKSLNILTKQT